MRNRNNLYLTKKYSHNEIIKLTYTRYRGFCNSIIKNAKREYEKTEINNAKHDTKKLWKVIKKITYTKKTRNEISA